MCIQFLRPLHLALLLLVLGGGPSNGTVPGTAPDAISGTWQLDAEVSRFGPLPAPGRQRDDIAMKGGYLSIHRSVALADGSTRVSAFELLIDGQQHGVLAGGEAAMARVSFEDDALVLVVVATRPEAGTITVTDRIRGASDASGLLVDRSITVPGQAVIVQRLFFRRVEVGRRGDDPRPSVKTLLARMVDALGGRDRVEQVTSIRQRGVITVDGLEAEGTMALHWQAPDLFVAHTTFPGAGRTSQGHDGEIAWRARPGQPPRRLTGLDAQEVLALADFRGPLTFAGRFASLRVTGPETFAGKRCWALAVRMEDGYRARFLVDAQTYRMAGLERILTAEGKATKLTSVYDRYATVEGRTLLVAWTIEVGGQVQRFDLSEVSSAAHPPGTFDLPEALRERPRA